jgi:peptidyl-prolyl cis-trans isomerase SurA
LRLRTLAVLVPLLALGPPAAAEELLVDGIAAQVGGDIVLVSEVMEMVGRTEQRMRAAGAPESEIAKLRAEGLETLIEERLIEKIVRDTELYASDEEIDKTIEAIAKENGISIDQLKESLASQGMAFDDYRAQMKREIERRKVINAMVANRVHLDEHEIRAAYEAKYASQPKGGAELHLRQLLVPAGEEVKRTTKESCTAVAALRERIARGESFEELAEQYSAAAPKQGGDIGWLHEDSLASWMVFAVRDLDDGGVSPVIELPFGCTIVKLVERKQYEPVTYEQAKDGIRQALFEEKLAAEYRSWMEELRHKTYIERRGYFADAAKLGSAPKQENSALP